MRVLTVRQPWAHAIAHLGKDVENRTWSTKYRGPIAIHAGRRLDRLGLAMVEEITRESLPQKFEGGSVVAVADLIDVHSPTDCWYDLGGGCSPWAESGALHWSLANVRPLAEPFGLLGSLGLRVLPADFEAEILRRVA
jgi:hypothetical protein